MSYQGAPQPLSTIQHNLPILGMPLPTRAPDYERDGHDIDLKGYFNILYDSRWLIGAITLLVTAMAVVYALIASPVYEANLMIHVEEESPNASKNILSEVSSLFETKKAAIAEMELLRSRMVISHAVDNLQLFINVRPKYFPVVGFWFADRQATELSEPGVFGVGGYVWGPERADVSVFDIPEAWHNREFTITARGGGRYLLGGAGLPVYYEGVVGNTLKAAAKDGNIELRIDRLDARAGAQFTLRRMSRLSTIERIQTAMVISEQGKQSGIIEVRLQGEDAQRINSLLAEIGREYMRQNLARKTEEAEKSLAFLNQQLPALKRQLEQSEEKYNNFRNSHGTIDMREEARMSLAQAASAQTRRIDLNQKRTELLQRFTEDHPVLVGLNRQRKEVDDEIANVARRIRTLPMLEQDEARLVREIKVNTELYTALSNTAQQLRLISVGRVSNVRLIDAPMAPERALKPNRPLIERLLGARVVYASIPHSSNQDRLLRKARNIPGYLPLLSVAYPEDIAIESMRSFRAALLFAMPHLKNNIVMFAGPGRAMGKSFLSANFAALMAASGKRVLLIDADLRNGHLHRYFGVSREQGLTKAISGAMPLEHIIHHRVLENLDFIPTGALPPNRAEFLQHLNFSNVLDTVSAQYDLVVIDPPPLLAVSDALIIGAHVGAVFLLARAGITTEGEITESVKRLNHAGIAPQGVVFNDMPLRIGGYAYQFSYGHVPQLKHGD